MRKRVQKNGKIATFYFYFSLLESRGITGGPGGPQRVK